MPPYLSTPAEHKPLMAINQYVDVSRKRIKKVQAVLAHSSLVASCQAAGT